LGCDPAYLGLPVLSALASAIGNTRTIRLERDWDEPSIIWSAIVGDSGTLKSPAHVKAVAYLYRLQKRLLLEFKEKAASYQDDLQTYKEAKRKAKDGGPDPGGPAGGAGAAARHLFRHDHREARRDPGGQPQGDAGGPGRTGGLVREFHEV
jgi:hypothetical protein